MSIDEIRSTLRDRARDVDDHALVLRADAVRRRVRARRRRQAVAGVAATAVVVPLTLLAMLGGNPFGSADDIAPADRSPGATVEVRREFAGRTLIQSDIHEGGHPMVLTATAQSGSEWQATCAGVDGRITLHLTLDGAFERTAPCSEVAEPGGTLSFRFSRTDPAGQDRRLRLWLTRTADGAVVTPPDAVVAAAVYALPEPVIVVAGSDILPLEEGSGQNWAYVDHVASAAGERSVTMELAASDIPRMLETVTSGSGAQVRLVVDGEVVLMTAGGNAGIFDLGSSNEGYTLEAGGPHTVMLMVVGTVPTDARLGIVVRTPAPS